MLLADPEPSSAHGQAESVPDAVILRLLGALQPTV